MKAHADFANQSVGDVRANRRTRVHYKEKMPCHF